MAIAKFVRQIADVLCGWSVDTRGQLVEALHIGRNSGDPWSFVLKAIAKTLFGSLWRQLGCQPRDAIRCGRCELEPIRKGGADTLPQLGVTAGS